MIKKLEKLNELDYEKFIEKDSNSRIQHILSWQDSICNTYKNCSICNYYLKKGKKIRAVFPFIYLKSMLFGNKIISMPFLDNGGFLGDFSQKDIRALIKKIKKDYPKLKGIQIRTNEQMQNYLKVNKYLKKLNFNVSNNRSQLILNLKSSDEIFSSLSKNTKRMIKIGEKNKLNLVVVESSQEINDFYKIYFKKMKSFGSPQHSKRFFLNLWSGLNPKNIRAISCYYNKKLLGTMICYLEKSYVYYIYSFTTEDRDLLKYRPNEFLYWNFIKWSADSGYNYFDFGQVELNSKKGSHAEGIYNFKKKWGGELFKRTYYDFPNKGENTNINKNSNLKKLRALWSKLPDGLIKLIGPKISSNLGL